NWSEIENSSQIWKGFLDDILPGILKTGPKPFFFTDFSDCSRKSKQEIQYAIYLLGRFRNYFRVILSLNQNEAALIARALDLKENVSDEEFTKELFKDSNSDVLVIHRTNDALAYDEVTYAKCDTFFCKEPKILTGGGDNFNAGFCYAQLHDFNLFQSLLVANAVAGSYVKTGTSPDVDKLIEFLEHFQD
ncbi:MAG: PfkB family carbohydrate kinase, partial [Bacteroidia bacterium]|nr:PfkB family carbohydrate kinase [Bacteroidia bacterium]